MPGWFAAKDDEAPTSWWSSRGQAVKEEIEAFAAIDGRATRLMAPASEFSPAVYGKASVARRAAKLQPPACEGKSHMMLDMSTFPSMEEGYASWDAAREVPFVVRAAPELAGASEAAVRAALSSEVEVSGYSDDGGQGLSGSEALVALDAGALPFNVIDCSTSAEVLERLLPAALRARAEACGVREKLRLAYVLSEPQQGKLHVDPLLGSAWQYLCQGKKQWFAVDPDGFEYRSNPTGEPLSLPPPQHTRPLPCLADFRSSIMQAPRCVAQMLPRATWS
mmetsp:Transcript_4498/g.14692  ORF Transcript_4498/g.14692 Transcript_4498/m.14692 type:complete len:279 (+) Transcript_4498:928-1764(+)